MKHLKIPACFFPTRIITLDDNQSFLDNFKFLLNVNNVNALPYHRPADVLNFFRTNEFTGQFINTSISWLEEEEFDHRTIDVNLKNLYQEIYNPNRFNEISIIISDYAMPSMNGLELFEQLELKTPIKRILLTGAADEKLAVEAFNENLIHAFIRKDAPNFNETLLKTIHQLQTQYFYDLTSIIMSSLTSDPNRTSCLSEPSFITFFHELLTKKKIVEYYLLDELGSFLLLDIKGNHYWLIVSTEEEIENDYETAQEYSLSQPVPKNILEPLKQKTKLLFLRSEDDKNIPPIEWQNNLYPATKLEGKNPYFYAIISKNDLTAPALETHIAYKDYLMDCV